MQFAKLFGPEDDQVLVKMDDGDNGPEVRVYFRPPGLGVCNFALSFGAQADQNAAWEACEAAFDRIDEKEARRIVASVMRSAALSNAG